MNINLHIDRLVLDGVDIKSHQKYALKVAVEAALKQQFISEHISPSIQSHHNLRSINAGSISIGNNHKPASIGKQIGQAIHRGIR